MRGTRDLALGRLSLRSAPAASIASPCCSMCAPSLSFVVGSASDALSACPIAALRSMNVATSAFRARLLAGDAKDGVAGLERWNRRGVDVDTGVVCEGLSGVSTVVQES